MHIDIKDPTALRLVNRLTKEMGELAVANAFMDEIGNDLIAENQRLNQEVFALREKNAALQNDNNTLKDQIDSKRKGRFNGPHSIKRSDTDSSGNNNQEPV